VCGNFSAASGRGSPFHSLEPMKARHYFPLLLSLATLSGCIALPIPHDRQISPEFFGVVTDSQTGLPIEGAVVTVTRPPYHSASEDVDPFSASATTDANGRYRVRVITASTWYVLFLGPAEGTCSGTIAVSNRSYQSETSSTSAFRGAAVDGMCNGYSVERNFQLKCQPNSEASDGL